MKKIFWILACAIGCLAAVLIFMRLQSSKEAKIASTKTTIQTEPVKKESPVEIAAAASLKAESSPKKGKSKSKNKSKDPAAISVEKQTAPSKAKDFSKKAAQDPAAREALKLVGIDDEAEQYWISAINDPELSANERKNLIEDLNEEGFSDPRNPTEEDLPIIVSRIELIEELTPTAMDQANAEAFQEAYKDLTNMYNRLTEQ